MSFPAEGTSQGPSEPAEHHAATQTKRPTSLGRHGSSWISRLHRHHDRKHRSDNDVERPLLADDHLNEEDEEAQDQPISASVRLQGPRLFLSTINHLTKKVYTKCRNALARNAKYILIVCLLALLTLLVSGCVVYFLHRKDHSKLSTCQSATCVDAASETLYRLDHPHAKVDACTQFDNMVCGGWQQHQDLPPDQSDVFTGAGKAEISKSVLPHILVQSSPASPSASAEVDTFSKLEDDYGSRTDEHAL